MGRKNTKNLWINLKNAINIPVSINVFRVFHQLAFSLPMSDTIPLPLYSCQDPRGVRVLCIEVSCFLTAFKNKVLFCKNLFLQHISRCSNVPTYLSTNYSSISCLCCIFKTEFCNRKQVNKDEKCYVREFLEEYSSQFCLLHRFHNLSFEFLWFKQQRK